MSTLNQLRGDSLKRQLESSQKYAIENDLILVDEIDGRPLKDIGISAYQSNNSEIGVLATFLRAVKGGKIEKGSVLLIESLDRLSRDFVLKALSQFIEILEAGIEIVSLIDGQRYTYEQINQNPLQLYISLGVMHRANEESATKSKRIIASWDSKRKNAINKPMTSKCPGWLVLNKQNNCFDLIPERVEVVKKIFEMCAHQCGIWTIAKYLNENRVPLFGKSKFWLISYIKKIISSRAVLGEFQPHRVINRKYIPEGNPIIKYFPVIISEELFYLAHSAISRRKIVSNGPKGTSFSNLFIGIGFCSRCGSRMVVRSVGAKKGLPQMYCVRRKQAGLCKMPSWSYIAVEKLITQHLLEIDFTKLLGRNGESESISNNLIALNSKSDEVLNQINATLKLTIDPNASSKTVERFLIILSQLEIELEAISKEITEKNKWLAEYNQQLKEFASNDLKEAIKLIDEKSEDYLFRASVHELFAKLIDRIDFYVDEDFYYPSDVEPNDIVVQKYLKHNYKARKLSFEQLTEYRGFKDFYRNYSKRVKITYKTGVVRQILIGNNTSFTFRKPKASA